MPLPEKRIIVYTESKDRHRILCFVNGIKATAITAIAIEYEDLVALADTLDYRIVRPEDE